MAALFEGTSINGMSLANRFVRSATWEGLADEHGFVTPRLAEMMVELARGEVGLIISGYAFISPEGQSSPRQLAVYDDRFLPGLRDMVKGVHAVGGKIALQLVHGGCVANAALSGLEPVGPSAVEKDGKSICRMLAKGKLPASSLPLLEPQAWRNRPASTRYKSMPPMASCSASFSPQCSTREQTNMEANSQTVRGFCSR